MKLGGIYAVHLRGDDGEICTFLPGQDVPAWAAKQITNPLAWASEETDIEPGDEVADGPPPQGGPGASRQKWADYAASQSVAVEESWKREDIIAACEKAGKPV